MANRLAAVIALIPVFWTLTQGADVTESEVSSLAGVSVKLTCAIGQGCPDVHSMRWYKNEERVFVLSPRANISRAENSLVSRAVLDFKKGASDAYLVIDKVELRDEGLYKCDITYIAITDRCNAVNYINFTTLVKPENITVYDGDVIIPEGKYDRVFTEDDDVTLTCIGGRGKPVPSVQWWKDGVLYNANTAIEERDESGVGTGTNRLKFQVTRADLNVKYECRVYHPALDNYISSSTQLEVNVRPNRLVLSGVEHHVVQGTTVLLKCEVFGARPPANVKWFNATMLLAPEQNSTRLNEGDGTYNTSSTLVFTATRYENEATITCEATNEVAASRREVPLREMIKLEVLYPPLVWVVPDNITVNESTDVLMFCSYESNPSSILDVKWFKDDVEIEKDPDSSAVMTDHTLLIKNSTRDDMGAYSCSLTNEVGTSMSNSTTRVSVHYKPEVNVTMDPQSPIVEEVVTNVTLSCNVMAGNPPDLVKVRWFFNGGLIEELPNCTNETLCVDDPSKLLLMNIDRQMHGNYTCMGKNEAGWGVMAEPSELVIYYPPSQVSLTYHPQRVVKRGSVTLVCAVKEIGRPSNTTFRWTRGSHTVMDVTTANWTIDPVTLETESNFTCTALNLGVKVNQLPFIFVSMHLRRLLNAPHVLRCGHDFAEHQHQLSRRVQPYLLDKMVEGKREHLRLAQRESEVLGRKPHDSSGHAYERFPIDTFDVELEYDSLAQRLLGPNAGQRQLYLFFHWQLSRWRS
uniref:Hemicentin-1 n=4 Tax=Lygus hesperus TaxID=30085 RepID=A0A0A9Y155_LYGHE